MKYGKDAWAAYLLELYGNGLGIWQGMSWHRSGWIWEHGWAADENLVSFSVRSR